MAIRRPKGFQGRVPTDWLTPQDAAGIISSADDPEFADVAFVICFTRVLRIGAALDLQRRDIQIGAQRGMGANPEGPAAHAAWRFHPDLCARLSGLMKAHDRHRMFRWHYGAQLAYLLLRAKLGYLGDRLSKAASYRLDRT